MSITTRIPDGFAPQPTVFNGGLERMTQLWEAARDANTHGYGGGVIHKIQDWGSNVGTTTSCSPFTASIVGAMFDPSGATDMTTTFAPMYDNGQTALPFAYYQMHNVFYFSDDAGGGAAEAQRRRKQWKDNGWPNTDNPVASTVFFNLGYEIDIRDVRRGDLIAIEWNHGGHAAFVWDVHLNAKLEVDCLQFLSANGYHDANGYHGIGVSVSTWHNGDFVDIASDGTITKKFPLFVDDDRYIDRGLWYCLPGVTKDDVRYKTFRGNRPTDGNVVDKSNSHYFASVRAARFWGFVPPILQHGDVLTPDVIAQAIKLQLWAQPAPYSNASIEE